MNHTVQKFYPVIRVLFVLAMPGVLLIAMSLFASPLQAAPSQRPATELTPLRNCKGTTPTACCATGYVLYNGQPVAGAEVTIQSAQGSVTVSSALGQESSSPYYEVSLGSAPLNVIAGDTITVTASYSGATTVRVIQAQAGGQQVDLGLNNSSQFCAGVTQIPQAECQALVALYSNTKGFNWANKIGWLTNNTPCGWHGLYCSAGHVTRLTLISNQLSGPIPPELSNLTNLTSLDLDNNQLSGSIPPELGNLTNLVYLLLNNNQLSGPIPPELGSLTNLTDLYLYSNQLNGSIPLELGNLTNLIWLWLASNQLSGSIPPELGNLTKLKYLLLDHNQLSGPIPLELGNLTNLIQLTLSTNQLSGSIPPELGNLTELKYLLLDHNQLSGSISPELGNLTNLIHLNLSANQLSGPIPPQLGNLTNLTLLWSFANQLSGSIPPELGNLTNLTSLELTNNQLSGSIPPELGNLTNLQWLYLYNNQLSRSIPPELGNLTYLRQLLLYSNQLSGSIPPELGNLTNLTSLELNNNQLSGSIPPELGGLTKLTSLWLYSNQLSGPLPSSLKNLTKLFLFFFHATNLCEPGEAAFQIWLDNIPNLTSSNQICPETSPTLKVSPSYLTFQAAPGSPNPAEQTLTIENLQGSGTLTWTAAETVSWLSLSSPSSMKLNVAVDSAGLTPGVYTGTITITAPGAQNSPWPVNVSFTIRSSAQPIWTMMFYLAGDNNLSSELEGKVEKLRAAAAQTNLNILVLSDSYGLNNSWRYKIQADGQYTNGINRWFMGELDMGNPTTLREFVVWAMASYPADYYYLNIAGHGRGTSGIAWDMYPANYITTGELRLALLQATGNGTKKIDVLHYDSCLMGMLEDAYDIKAVANYMVASENLGWSLFAFADYAEAAASAQPRDLAVKIAEIYYNRLNNNRFYSFPHTIAAVDLAQVTTMRSHLDNLVTALNAHSTEYKTNIMNARLASQKFDSTGYYMIDNQDEYLDLYDLAQKLKGSISDPVVQAAAQDVMDSVPQTVIAEYHRSGVDYMNGNYWNLDNAHGLSLYFPPGPGGYGYNDYLAHQFIFTQDSLYDNFLSNLFGIGPTAMANSTDSEMPPMGIYRESRPIFLPIIIK